MTAGQEFAQGLIAMFLLFTVMTAWAAFFDKPGEPLSPYTKCFFQYEREVRHDKCKHLIVEVKP